MFNHLTFDEYQRLARRADSGSPNDLPTIALALAGESAALADRIKAEVGCGQPPDREQIQADLGYLLWYIQRLAALYELDLSTVAAANVVSLLARIGPGGQETAEGRKNGSWPNICSTQANDTQNERSSRHVEKNVP